MNRILKNWDFSRFFKLGIGLLIGVMALTNKDTGLVLVSIFFLVQALFDISFCGPAGCGVPTTRKQEPILKDQIENYKK